MTINYQQALQDMRLQERSETDEVNYADFMASFHTRVGIYIAFLAGFYLYLTVFIGLDTALLKMQDWS